MSGQVDYRRIEKKESTEGKFPVEVESEYRVFIDEKAYQTMKTHAGTTNDVEICGVLVGEVKRDPLGPFLVIHATIEGKNANNMGTQVTITHQTWDHINSIMDKEYPKQRIVGWYHTHPGFGVFLSKMDLFIQEGYFNHAFQVAIVIETVKKQEGCFAWRDGKCIPLRRYWVGKEEVKLVSGDVEEPAMSDMRKPTTGAATTAAAPAPRADEDDFRSSGFSFMHLFMMILVFLCGFMLGKLFGLQEARGNIAEGLESEMYTLMEAAGMNAMAGKDILALKERVGAAEELLKKNDAPGAVQTLGQTRNEIEALAASYDKRRMVIHSDLAKMVTMRQSLGERISMVELSQEKLLTLMMQARLQDMLAPEGQPIDFSTLSEGRRDVIRATLSRTMQLAPETKKLIDQIHPKAIEMLFPSREAPADDKSGKTAGGEKTTSSGKSETKPDAKTK